MASVTTEKITSQVEVVTKVVDIQSQLLQQMDLDLKLGPITVWAAANKKVVQDVIRIKDQLEQLSCVTKCDCDQGQVTEEEGEGQLDSRLMALINMAKVGDLRALQKMTTAVKQFLHKSGLKEEKRRSLNLLLKHQDFIPPLLLKCLKSNVTKVPALVSESLWILNALLEDIMNASIMEAVKELVDAGAIQIISKLVSVQDTRYNLNGQAIVALENFASRGYRDQLLASATGFGLLPSLTKVARKKNTSIQLQTKIIHVVSSLLGQVRANLQVCSGSDKSSNDHAGYQNMIDNLPPVSLFKEVLPLLNVLIETKDNELLGKTLACLAFGGCVQGSFQPIIDSGILKKVAPLVSHADEVVKFFVITAISSIASLNEEQAMSFLKSMKGTFGLKYYHKALTSENNNDALVWAADQFFSAAVNGITNESDPSTLSAILTSGFVHTLVHLLKFGNHEKHILGSAWAIGRISSEVPLSQRRIFVEIGAIPYFVELLKNPNEIISSMAAVSIANLVQEKPLNRDQFITLGGIDILVGVIQRKENSLQGLVSILASLEMISDIRPPAPAEVMKDVPKALLSIIDNKSIKFPEKLVPGIYSIVGKLCESGNDYIDLVIESGLLARLETAISTGNLDCQVFALEAIECISRGTQKHHDALLVIDIVETLITLLQSPTKYIRRVALCTLANLYKGQLTPECRMSIQQKVPQILINITNQDPRSSHPAGLSFQNVLNYFKYSS